MAISSTVLALLRHLVSEWMTVYTINDRMQIIAQSLIWRCRHRYLGQFIMRYCPFSPHTAEN